MSSDIMAAFPARIALAIAISSIFFLIYFSLDIYLFLTKRSFGRVNIELVYFTRNDNPKRADAIHFRIIESAISLKQAYGNRFLFWRVIFRSLKATLDSPAVNFGKYTYPALVPFRDRVAARCSIGELKRTLGFPFREEKHQIIMVDDLSEDKRRYILKVLVIKEADMMNIEAYLKDPPKTEGKFELFKLVVQAFREKPEAFLPVQIVVA